MPIMLHACAKMLYRTNNNRQCEVCVIVETLVHGCQLCVLYYFILLLSAHQADCFRHAHFCHVLVQIKYAEAHLQPVPTLRRPARSHTHTLTAGEFDNL